MNRYDTDREEYQSYVKDDTFVVRLKGAAFSMTRDMSLFNEYIDLLNAVETEQSIQGYVQLCEAAYDARKGYETLLHLLTGPESSHFSNRVGFRFNAVMAHFRNAIGRLLLTHTQFSRPMVAGLHGELSGEYLGLVLPFDCRFATPETSISFLSMTYGLPVPPALSYFLPRYIGQGRAADLIHHQKTISAEDALSLGLISDIVPSERLEARCLEEIATFSEGPAYVIPYNRNLLNPDASELERHVESYYNTMSQVLIHLRQSQKSS